MLLVSHSSSLISIVSPGCSDFTLQRHGIPCISKYQIFSTPISFVSWVLNRFRTPCAMEHIKWEPSEMQMFQRQPFYESSVSLRVKNICRKDTSFLSWLQEKTTFSRIQLHFWRHIHHRWYSFRILLKRTILSAICEQSVNFILAIFLSFFFIDLQQL